MSNLMDHPLLVFVLTFFLLSFSAWIGKSLAEGKRILEGTVRQDFGVILAATLTLLGLIAGFTFSMALNRYDQRKNYEEQEANAIGTEYLRAGVLPAADAAKVQTLLLNYLDQRVLFYSTVDDEQLRKIDAQTAKLQAELWSAVRTPVERDPVTALAVSGMNDVLNSQGYTLAAWRNRIPIAGWALMVVIAICSNMLVGFGAANDKPKFILLLVLPLIVSITFLFIADIDSPRAGFIRVIPQNILSLSQSLHAQ